MQDRDTLVVTIRCDQDPIAPVVWLRLEPDDDTYVPAELRLTPWTGDDEPEELFLATTGFHRGPITWLGEDAR